MTERARKLFDAYVTKSLNHPDLKDLSIASHVFNFNVEVSDARIPGSEMIEEIGPYAQALLAARKKA